MATRFVTLGLLGALPLGGTAVAQPSGLPGTSQVVFRSSVDLVSLSAVVRDRRGRIVRGLGPEDFEVFDAGVPRSIVEFSPAEEGPVSLAVLFDTSGSMRMSDNLGAGRLVIESLLGQLRTGTDEVSLYAFDSGLREIQGFTTDPGSVRRVLATLDSFGSTALYDAVGVVAEQLDDRQYRRRALVVVTDGLDTMSHMTAAEVSGIASRSDVPVYVVAVGSTEATPEAGTATFVDVPTAPGAHLGNLAYWTGGAVFVARGSVPSGATARAILAELRHQYLLAFESAGPGWRALDVRLRRRDGVTIRTRSAYQSNRPLG